MDELQRKLKERKDANQPKPNQRMSPIGKNYGTGRTAQQARAFTGMAHGKARGDAKCYFTGNIMVAGRHSDSGQGQSEQIAFASQNSFRTAPKDEVFIVAKRFGAVNYTGSEIPQPPDEDETIRVGRNIRPTQPSNTDLMNAFLERCRQIRGSLPDAPLNSAVANQINRALQRIMVESERFGIVVTIYPAFDEYGVLGNVDWEDARAYSHTLVKFSTYNYWVSARDTSGRTLIPPAIPIYNSNGQIIGYPSPNVALLLRFVYYAFYLQAIPVQYQPDSRNLLENRLWGFWAQAFGEALGGGVVVGDPNRRPNQTSLKVPLATQYAIGNGSGTHAKSQVTVEFDRIHVGTFPMSGGGCEVLLANDMNVRKIRYNNGAIVADYLVSAYQSRLEYPFLYVRELELSVQPTEEHTPMFHVLCDYSHFVYRNKYGNMCYGGENIPDTLSNIVVNDSNIGNRYRRNDMEEDKVDMLFTNQWAHQVRFTNPLTFPSQRALSPDYLGRTSVQRNIGVTRRIWLSGNGIASRPSTVQKRSTQFNCRGLGLTPNQSETLPATQFDPGAKKYTRNLPNQYTMGFSNETIETSGWEFTHIVFVKRKL